MGNLLRNAAAVGNESHAGLDSEQAIKIVQCMQ